MAGSRIKGITIEIGGDTSKLSDSLKSVDKSLRTTQSQLKDVNKLLKLDPTNTELLRQKHDLLGKAVSDTREKLKQEEEALKQLQNAGNTDETREQQDALQRELVETRSKLGDLENEYRKSEPTLAKFAATSQQVAEKTKRISQAAAGLGAALLGNAYKAALAADDLNTLSRNTGIAVEELQKMQYASDTIDVSVDQMAGSLKKLTQQMGKGSDVFDTLGVSIYDSNGNMRDAVEVWYDSLEALSHISNETERDTIAMELFGRSAMDLSGIIDDGGQALREMGQDAEDMGLILSGDALASANEFNDAIDLLKARTSAAFLSAGAALAKSLAPALEKLVDKISGALKWFAELDGSTQTLILTIAGIVAAISPLASLFANVTTVAAGFSAALAFIATPAGAAILAITALISAGVFLYKNWDKIKAEVKKMRDTTVKNFTDMKNIISNLLTALKNAISNVFKTIVTTVSNAVKSMKDTATNTVNAMKAAVIGTFNAMKDGISGAINSAYSAVTGTFNNIVNTISGAVNNAYNTAVGVFNSMRDGISGAISGIVGTVSGVFGSVRDAISGAINSARDAVTGAISTIKGAFNFSWSLPHINIPHFRVHGGEPPYGFMGQGTFPSISIDWYKKAYDAAVMFKQPTVLATPNGFKGFGDGNGAEIVIGERKLREMLGGGVTINMTVNGGNSVSASELSDIVIDKLTATINRNRQRW